jgi:hypothetical protein
MLLPPTGIAVSEVAAAYNDVAKEVLKPLLKILFDFL